MRILHRLLIFIRVWLQDSTEQPVVWVAVGEGYQLYLSENNKPTLDDKDISSLTWEPSVSERYLFIVLM